MNLKIQNNKSLNNQRILVFNDNKIKGFKGLISFWNDTNKINITKELKPFIKFL